MLVLMQPALPRLPRLPATPPPRRRMPNPAAEVDQSTSDFPCAAFAMSCCCYRSHFACIALLFCDCCECFRCCSAQLFFHDRESLRGNVEGARALFGPGQDAWGRSITDTCYPPAAASAAHGSSTGAPIFAPRGCAGDMLALDTGDAPREHIFDPDGGFLDPGTSRRIANGLAHVSRSVQGTQADLEILREGIADISISLETRFESPSSSDVPMSDFLRFSLSAEWRWPIKMV